MLYGIFVSKAPRLHPALPAFPRACGPERMDCKISLAHKHARGRKGEVLQRCVWEGGSRNPDAPEAGRELYCSSSWPEKEGRRRIPEGPAARALPAAPRPRFRRAAGTAQARHGRGRGGGGRRRPQGRARPLRALPLRGGIPGKRPARERESRLSRLLRSGLHG